VSGGEPLQQAVALTALLARIRQETSLSTLVFTGYSWSEIASSNRHVRLPCDFLDQIDVLIAGRYRHEQRVARGLKGSANKTIHFLSSRYTANDLEAVPEAEVCIEPNGEIILTGIEPMSSWTILNHT
jgi:anaerobic ribonucleoside-triphosphate reductase activating protein